MRIFLILLSVFWLLSLSSQAQSPLYTIKIQTLNEQQLPVGDVTISLPDLRKNLITDEGGEVTLRLPGGSYRVWAMGLGVHNESFDILVSKDATFLITIEEVTRVLEEVEVNESRVNEKVRYQQAGIEAISSQQIARLPMLGGEKDIVKSFTLLPGVQSGTEGGANLLVRGGTSDQNLYLLDQATLYHSGHLLGFLSSFNPLAIDSVTLYKGGFPARYGGRLSAVLDTRVREANLDSVRGAASVGIISSRAALEVPIVRHKASLMLAARRTYLDLFQRLAAGENQAAYGFYDLNAKLAIHPSADQTLTAHYYHDQDSYYEIDDNPSLNTYQENRLTWANRVAGVSYTAPLTSRWQQAWQASYSQYRLEQKEVRRSAESVSANTVRYESTLREVTAGNKFTGQLSDVFSLDGGVQLSGFFTRPVTLESVGDQQTITSQRLPDQRAYQAAAFMEGHWNTDRYTLDLGVRGSHYTVSGERGFTFVEPRLNVSRWIGAGDAIKLSYAAMTQPLHLLTDPGLGLPINFYVASTEQIPAQRAHQLNGGYYTSVSSFRNTYNVSVEGYAKRMLGIIEYRDGYSSTSFTAAAQNEFPQWEDVVSRGTGTSYGVEVLIEKTTGEFTGWLAYTFSRTRHRFEDLNGGKVFPSRYDRPHDLSLVGFYQLNEHWQASATFSYATGQPVTLPRYTYLGYGFDFERGQAAGQPALSYTQGERNSYRMKDFHRLDVALQRGIHLAGLAGSMELGVYNLYNRKNPYYYYASTSGAGGGITTLKSVSLFPIIPSVSISLEW